MSNDLDKMNEFNRKLFNARRFSVSVDDNLELEIGGF